MTLLSAPVWARTCAMAASEPTENLPSQVERSDLEINDGFDRSGSEEYSRKDDYCQLYIIAHTVLTQLDILANKTCSSMQNKSKIHLPHFTEKQVYETYCQMFSRIYPSDNCA